MRRGDRTIGPVQLLRGLTVDRRRPDLAGLARETDPEAFVWNVLPHAARSFAASIVVLPEAEARASAVAYLYCRMLDTYEDLVPDPETAVDELARFADRLDRHPPPRPTALPQSLARGDRDRVYLLLIERCELVDAVFATLESEVQDRIRELVRSMADGMAWSTRAFASQGGVLEDEQQLALYCRNVIGYPALFTLDQVSDRDIPGPAREDALLVSEMIQLANVTRDIERDLQRGVAYHPALRPFLGRSGFEAGTQAVVREVREEYLAMALGRAPAYRRLFEGLGLGGTAPVRIAAVLMLLFTDLHYRGCASATGHSAWPGPKGRLQVVASSLPAMLSPSWAAHTVRRVERDFLGALTGMRPGSPRPARAAP
jgi:phytoene/squalene synthetase